MEVNGHKLPDYLVQLIQEGRWKRPVDTKPLLKLADMIYEPDFCSLERMREEIDANFDIVERGDGETYGMASSLQSGIAINDPGILDIDQAVIIVINEEEDTICLDYRGNEESPRIVALGANAWQSGKWKIIASDFQTFAREIGL